MTVVIGPKELAAIAALIERARANPLSLEQVKKIAVGGAWSGTPTRDLKLRDRAQDFVPAPGITIPFGRRVAFSFEEQPGGLMRHLSVSAERQGKLPHPEEVWMIAEAFGFTNWRTNPDYPRLMWLEEFEPGHEAINIVEPVQS